MGFPKLLKEKVCSNCGSLGTLEYYSYNKFLDYPLYRCSRCGIIANEPDAVFLELITK
ncbi:MAG: hypothetical protein H3Z52_15735 [archaeon]|nr:hypothetical protein [archaeon]MCP8322368.1 hypothetical protein [archaeon]